MRMELTVSSAILWSKINISITTFSKTCRKIWKKIREFFSRNFAWEMHKGELFNQKLILACFTWLFDFRRCATVLTSHREDMRFFIDHIERFKLRMNLYFLGDNLQKVINKLEGVNKSSNNISTNKGKLLLKPSKYFVLHWNNSEIIDSSYEAITMPPCELYFDMKNQTNVCRYEITPVSIFYNRFIIGNENPGPIFKTLAKVNIDSVQSIFEIYRKFDEKLKTLNLLTMVKENFTESIHGYYNDIACQWLNKHKEVYQVGAEKSWIHSEENTFREVFIGGLWVAGSFDRLTSNEFCLTIPYSTDFQTWAMDRNTEEFT